MVSARRKSTMPHSLTDLVQSLQANPDITIICRDVTEQAKIWIRQTWILYFKSVGFRFVTKSQLVQFSQAKNAKFFLKFTGVY